MPITLKQFKATCSRFFPGTPITKAPPSELFPEKVFYDCRAGDRLWLRFSPADKYLGNHVCIFGMEPPNPHPIWDIYVYTKEELTRELNFITKSPNMRKASE